LSPGLVLRSSFRRVGPSISGMITSLTTMSTLRSAPAYASYRLWLHRNGLYGFMYYPLLFFDGPEDFR
jgi:hypothetical protein